MFTIKLSVVLLFVCFISVIQCKDNDTAALVKRYQMECIETTRVNPELITKIKHGDWKLPQEKIQLVKDWALCVLMKSGLMTQEGVYKIDVALAKVPEKERDSVEKLIDSCLSTKAIPAPDIAFDFVRCYQRAKGNYTRMKALGLRTTISTTTKATKTTKKRPQHSQHQKAIATSSVYNYMLP